MSDSHDQSDAKRTAERVLTRDRRRIRSWAAATVGLWLLAGLLIPSVYLPLGGKLKQFAQTLPPTPPDAALPTAEQLPQTVADLQHQQWIVRNIVVHGWIVGA